MNVLNALCEANLPMETRFWVYHTYMHVNIFVAGREQLRRCISCFQQAPDGSFAQMCGALATVFSRYDRFVRQGHDKHKAVKKENLVMESYFGKIKDAQKYFDYDVFIVEHVNPDTLIQSYDDMYADLTLKRQFQYN